MIYDSLHAYCMSFYYTLFIFKYLKKNLNSNKIAKIILKSKSD
jgi:hypothetical protein